MPKLEMTLPRMPVRTWERLGINDTDAVIETGRNAASVATADAPAGMIWRAGEAPFAWTGEDPCAALLPPEGGAALDGGAARYALDIPAGFAGETPAVVTLRPGERSAAFDLLVRAGKGSRAAVAVRLLPPEEKAPAGDSAEQGVPRHWLRVRADVGASASLTLVLAQSLPDSVSHTAAAGAVVGEDGELKVVLAELGGAAPQTGVNLVLAGERARGAVDAVYLGEGERSLDFALRIEHRGRKTLSAIRARGVLLGNARKIFRDTLDFLPGSSGSKGREDERVLMLSPAARNISVPVLLCGEDDMEGEHAASSGRPDEKTLFYLMSRGLSETRAVQLLAQAAVAEVVESIPDGELRQSVRERLDAAIREGGRTA